VLYYLEALERRETMSSVVQKLVRHKLFHPKYSFVGEPDYEVIMGSLAYGVSNDTSDMDIYAMCVPHKSMVFPHLAGHVPDFGPKPENFTSQQKHHMQLEEREYDVVVYSIVMYFQLCMENNPNMLDSLFVPDRCVIHASEVGQHMRAHRRLFLSKYVYTKLRGYAFGELKKLKRDFGKEGAALADYKPKRRKAIEQFGYDVKSAYHVVRLMREAEQVLTEGDLDLEVAREQLKAVRRGSMTLEELEEWFFNKEKALDTTVANSSLPAKPDVDRLRVLLLECLEMKFGSLEVAQSIDPDVMRKYEQIVKIVNGK
jgi:predicted nucleotidyltransferase